MRPNVEVSELCRREGINPTQYYGWKKQLLSSVTKSFDAHAGKPRAAEERKEAELQRLKNVVAEITAENRELKKRFRAGGPRPTAAQVAAAGPRSSGADAAAERLASEADSGRLGHPAADVLPLAQEEAGGRELLEQPLRPVPPYEALPQEKQAVLDYARRPPERRHRELAWPMVDEDIACLSPSTVYRLLQEAKLGCPWRRRAERRRAQAQARHRRERKLGLHHGTLPFTAEEDVVTQ